MKRVAIITSSDMGYQGKREDLSGPAIKEIVEREGYQVVSMDILPDDRSMLSKRMAEIADGNQAELILTTGGTRFFPKRCDAGSHRRYNGTKKCRESRRPSALTA